MAVEETTRQKKQSGFANRWKHASGTCVGITKVGNTFTGIPNLRKCHSILGCRRIVPEYWCQTQRVVWRRGPGAPRLFRARIAAVRERRARPWRQSQTCLQAGGARKTISNCAWIYTLLLTGLPQQLRTTESSVFYILFELFFGEKTHARIGKTFFKCLCGSCVSRTTMWPRKASCVWFVFCKAQFFIWLSSILKCTFECLPHASSNFQCSVAARRWCCLSFAFARNSILCLPNWLYFSVNIASLRKRHTLQWNRYFLFFHALTSFGPSSCEGLLIGKGLGCCYYQCFRCVVAESSQRRSQSWSK